MTSRAIEQILEIQESDREEMKEEGRKKRKVNSANGMKRNREKSKSEWKRNSLEINVIKWRKVET